jgi:hypothetical protein
MKTLIIALTLLIGTSFSTEKEPEASSSQVAVAILLINEYPELFKGDRLINGLTVNEYMEMVQILENHFLILT